MPYLFTGRLCGRICTECPEPVFPGIVRIYRLPVESPTNVLIATRAADSLRLLSDDEVSGRQKQLVGEAKLDENGGFSVEMDDERYQGEALGIDLRLENGKRSIQFTVTAVQPLWRERDRLLVWGWDFCLPSRIWCRIKEILGRWTICGRVMVCEGKVDRPVGGVKVFAFDRDWLQDDALGTATTDAGGRFRLDYSPAQFRPGTWTDVELVGGPDLYFRVETGSGTVILQEDPERGRQPDRENVGPCFCVKLCVKEPGEDDHPDTEYAAFTHVGVYPFLTAIDSAPAGTGFTLGDNRAFHNTLRLNGVLAQKLGGVALEYRFEVSPLDNAGNPTGWVPVDLAQVAETRIGVRERYAPAFPGDPNPIKTTDYRVNGVAGPTVLVPDVVDGWIRVPQENSVFGPQGKFKDSGDLIGLITQTLAASPHVDLTGLAARSSSTSTGQPLVANRHYALRMRIRQVGTAGAGVISGQCDHLAVNNTRYDNILRHPGWMPEAVSNQLAVCMIDVTQLTSAGCAKITDALDVRFTAAHPNLGNVIVWMKGPGGPYAFTLPAPLAPGDHAGTASPSGWVVADLPPCAYIVKLQVNVQLTDGDANPSPLEDEMAYCKVLAEA